MMADYYPPVGFHFLVKFNLGEGDSDNRFQDVSGLSAEISTEELKEGGLNGFSYKLPTQAKYGNLTLKRGMLLDSKVVDWIKEAVENFEFSPTEIDVSLLDQEHNTLAAWSFTGAYPVKWSITDLKAMENSIVVETLELAYQSFRQTAP